MTEAQVIARQIADDVHAVPHGITADIRRVRQGWSKRLKGEPGVEVLAIAKALNVETRSRWVAYELVRFHPGAFKTLNEADLLAFSRGMDSWYAVDGFGTILVGAAWVRGTLTDATVVAWAASSDRWLRRLALVATVGLNARGGGGPGDPERTLAVCERLLADRDDMVVKAMSWALRVLSQRHRAEVEAFLDAQEETLAPRAKRELRNKLATGLKTPKRALG